MASARREAALRQIDRLFGEGTLAGLSDIRLIEQYIAHRDELAFEALVRRHGSMVLGVCRRALDDPNDADDAFQAAFLLLRARPGRSGPTAPSAAGCIAWPGGSPCSSGPTPPDAATRSGARPSGPASRSRPARSGTTRSR